MTKRLVFTVHMSRTISKTWCGKARHGLVCYSPYEAQRLEDESGAHVCWTCKQSIARAERAKAKAAQT